MLQVGNLKFFVILSILLLIHNTSGLKCWSCSSDSVNVYYCGKTMDPSLMTKQQQKQGYVECGPPPPILEFKNITNVIPKCKIVIKEVREQPIYSRSCEWEEKNVPTNACTNQKEDVSFVKIIECRTCANDGCNEHFKLASDPVEEDTTERDEHNLAIVAALSNTIFVIFVLSLVISF